MDAIIPAHNEQATVGGVASAVVLSHLFRRVTVVDDGSTDETGTRAAQAGAEVLRLDPNRGKAEAMLAAVVQSDADAFAFFDADLIGFRPEHAVSLADHFDAGFDMVCGLRDYGLLNVFSAVMPLMTGERIVRRWVLEALPATCWQGYAIETAMNYVVDSNGGSTCLVPMSGVRIINKVSKVGWFEGMIANIRMLRQMNDAGSALRRSEGGTCSVQQR